MHQMRIRDTRYVWLLILRAVPSDTIHISNSVSSGCARVFKSRSIRYYIPCMADNVKYELLRIGIGNRHTYPAV